MNESFKTDPSLMHKKARKQFAEDKQTKDMDYWNHVLWSDETKIHLFSSDGVKRVWWQPGIQNIFKDCSGGAIAEKNSPWNPTICNSFCY